MCADFIFVYGSNMDRSELRSWVEADGYDSSMILSMTPAQLDGYDFVWNFYSQGRGGGTVNLEHKENSTIWGILVEIEEALLKAFDRKKGNQYLYSRGDARVPVMRQDNGKTVFAWVYTARANKGARREVRPTRDYRRIILTAATYWSFPEKYIEKIASWPTS
jgi:gamma-glutamylcyclotransferase (GGCT)/AIG2-like uncharacterized protein YtfP